MTLVRLAALQKHWRRHPRADWMIASYLGHKPPVETRVQKERSMADMISMFGLVPGKTVSG